MKKVKSIIVAVLCFAVMLTSAFSAYAATADQAVLDARNGVVKVLVYVNKSPYPTASASGFLINEDTIVTAGHAIDDYEYDGKVTKVTVVAVGDIEIETKLQSASYHRDFAILKLKQAINTRGILPLGAPTSFDATSQVYALGFPFVKEWTSDTPINYSPTDVTVTGGAVSSISEAGGVKTVQHSANLDSGNSGGPLVYSDGKSASVVGINVAATDTGVSTYYYSVHIDELLEVLDTLGIAYTKADPDPPVETPPTPNPGTDKTNTQTITEPKETPPAKKNNTGIIIGGAAAAVVVVLAIIIAIVVSSKKKSSPAAPVAGGFTPPTPAAPPVAPPAAPSSATMTGPGSEGTTVLSANNGDANATTVLGASAATAMLVRSSNNEKINITKPYFKLGKDASRVDYCITGNSAVSRFHASIVAKNGQYFIIDNATTNHTYVNDSMIPANVETQISNGTQIKLADEKFEFRV